MSKGRLYLDRTRRSKVWADQNPDMERRSPELHDLDMVRLGTLTALATSQRWYCLPSSQAHLSFIFRPRRLQRDASLPQRQTKGVLAAIASSPIRSALCVLKRASCSRPRRRYARPGQRPVRRRPSECRRGSHPWRKPCPSFCVAPSGA